MTDAIMTLDIAAIKARADKATAGPWESDTTENEGDYGSGPDCGSGFSSYEVVAKKGRICDTINSDVAMVCEEYDEDGRTAFDEVGQANMDFIAHARTDIPALIAALETSETARVKAEQALWELDAVGCDFGYYEQAAKTMKSIVDKAIDGLLKQPSILTSTEQKAQGKRCSCGGADDYCVCQNSPDKTTISKRITALEQERDALKEELRHIVEMTDAENPESYRADDREGCLDTVHDTARRALESKP